jgi:hypothetical protein
MILRENIYYECLTAANRGKYRKLIAFDNKFVARRKLLVYRQMKLIRGKSRISFYHFFEDLASGGSRGTAEVKYACARNIGGRPKE